MKRANLALLIVLACLATLPLMGGAYALRLGTMACMYAILALSWNVVGGLAGYPSFATAAFFGFGAAAPPPRFTWPEAATLIAVLMVAASVAE